MTDGMLISTTFCTTAAPHWQEDEYLRSLPLLPIPHLSSTHEPHCLHEMTRPKRWDQSAIFCIRAYRRLQVKQNVGNDCRARAQLGMHMPAQCRLRPPSCSR